MSRTFYLEVIATDKTFFTGEVETLTVRTPDGEIGILGGHTPMVTAIAACPMKIRKDGDVLNAYIAEGFMEIKQDKTIIITDFAEWPNEIDVERAKEAEERALKRLSGPLSPIEKSRTEYALTRARTRIKVAKMG